MLKIWVTSISYWRTSCSKSTFRAENLVTRIFWGEKSRTNCQHLQ